MTNMLLELNLPTLKERRRDKRLSFLYNISKDKVPGIPANNYLETRVLQQIITFNGVLRQIITLLTGVFRHIITY